MRVRNLLLAAFVLLATVAAPLPLTAPASAAATAVSDPSASALLAGSSDVDGDVAVTTSLPEGETETLSVDLAAVVDAGAAVTDVAATTNGTNLKATASRDGDVANVSLGDVATDGAHTARVTLTVTYDTTGASTGSFDVPVRAVDGGQSVTATVDVVGNRVDDAGSPSAAVVANAPTTQRITGTRVVPGDASVSEVTVYYNVTPMLGAGGTPTGATATARYPNGTTLPASATLTASGGTGAVAVEVDGVDGPFRLNTTLTGVSFSARARTVTGLRYDVATTVGPGRDATLDGTNGVPRGAPRTTPFALIEDVLPERGLPNHWVGQTLYYNATADGDGSGVYELRRGAPGGPSTFVRELPVRPDGTLRVTTASLGPGAYYLTNDARRYESADATFELTRQRLTATFRDDFVEASGPKAGTALVLDSNRVGYSVALDPDDLDPADYDEVFNGSGTYDAERGVYLLQVEGTGRVVPANFTGRAKGAYDFTAAVTDAQAFDSPSVRVGVVDSRVDLRRSVSEDRGDVATFTAEFNDTDTGYVRVGSEEMGYEATLRVHDGGGDNRVEVEMNTYDAGFRDRDGGYAVTADSEDDGDTVTVVDAPNASLDEPLVAGVYPIATGVDTRIEDGTGNRTLDEVQDTGTLTLRERETGDVTVLTAPRTESLTALEDLRGRATPVDDVAAGDAFVVRVNVSGVFGQLDGDTPLANLTRSHGDGLFVEVEPAEADPNSGDETVPLTAVAGEDSVQVDPANDTLYVVLRATDRFETDRPYAASFELNETNPLVAGDEDAFEPVGERTSTTATVVDRTVDLRPTPVTLQQRYDASVPGRTSLAPGTNVTVRLRRPGGVVVGQNRTPVGPDHRFAATVDLADATVGQNLTVAVRDGRGQVGDDARAVVVEPRFATLSVADQRATVTGSRSVLVVDSVDLPEGGYVSVQETVSSLRGEVVAHTEYLSPGRHEDVRVPLDRDPAVVAGSSERLRVVVHRDDGDRVFESSANRVYEARRTPVAATVRVTYPSASTTTTATTRATTTPTTAATTRATTATRAPATPSRGQPGFGASTALLALAVGLAAALLRVRG